VKELSTYEVLTFSLSNKKVGLIKFTWRSLTTKKKLFNFRELTISGKKLFNISLLALSENFK